MSAGQITYDMLSRQQNGRLTPLILGGPPGAGKTHAAMSLLSRKADGSLDPFCRIAAAGKTKEDFTTYPVPKELEDGEFIIKQPITESTLLPLLASNIGDGYGVLLVDDVTAADPSVQSALLEVAQFGRIGEHQLGKNVAIVMTGNGISDGAYAAQWSSALINRSHYVEFKPSLEVWKELDENANIDPVMYGWLEATPDAFAPEVTNKEQKNKWFDEKGRAPSPRQLTTLGNALMDKWGGIQNFKPNILFKSSTQFVDSLIGEKAAANFMVFAEIMIKYPTGQQLMEDPSLWDKVLPEDKNKPGAVYAVAHSLRQYASNLNANLNEKHGSGEAKAATKEKEKLVKQFAYAVAKIMKNDRDKGAFCARYFMSRMPVKDTSKGLLANLAFDLDGDPVLKDAGFGKILEDVKAMGETMVRTK